MKEVEFRVPDRCDLSAAEALIEQTCAAHGLIVGMKGSLASLPGCIHWHFKKPREKGILEITLHPRKRRLWAQVQDGRRAPWIDVKLPDLKKAIEKGLSGRP